MAIDPGDPAYEIWIVVAPHTTGRLYPQGGPASVEAKGDWVSTPIFDRTWFGINEDIRQRFGKVFDVLAVLADDQAQVELNRYEVSGTFLGYDRLPTGAVIYRRITLIRP